MEKFHRPREACASRIGPGARCFPASRRSRRFVSTRSTRGRARLRYWGRVATSLLAGLSFSLLVSCRAAPPEASVSRDFGTVRAATEEVAGRVSDQVEEILPKLERILVDLLVREVEVWVQDRIELYDGAPYPEHIAGMADFSRGRIHLRNTDQRVAVHLAHELVHVLLGPSWRPLPGVMEEGLCDLVAALVVPVEGRRHHVKRLVEASGFIGGLEVVLAVSVPAYPGASPGLSHDPSDRSGGMVRRRARVQLLVDADPSLDPVAVLSLDEGAVFDRATGDDSVGLYGLGYLFALALVERVGFDGLNGLCLRAAEESMDLVPATWVLRACGFYPAPGIDLVDGEVDGDGAHATAESARERDRAVRRAMARALHEYLGPTELPELAEVLSESLGRAAVQSLRGSFDWADADEFLRVARPSLNLPHRHGSVALWDLPGFVAAVHAAWDESIARER